MEVLLKLTAFAKSRKCDKYVRYVLRQWLILAQQTDCIATHVSILGGRPECSRCVWLANSSRIVPWRCTRKFLKQWYRQ